MGHSAIPPGPFVARHEVVVSGETTMPNEVDVAFELRFEGDGRGVAQVLDELQAARERLKLWRFIGCEVVVEWGRGPVRYVLGDERGQFTLAK
jgi:hypothetical protein